MFPVIILMVGDAQGNHKLCGMYDSFYGTSRVNHIVVTAHGIVLMMRMTNVTLYAIIMSK